jgi:hypothetical protein
MFGRRLTGGAAAIGLALYCLGSGTALAQCPTGEWVCSYWPSIIYGVEGEFIAGTQGPACFEPSYGDEVTVVAADDSLLPDKFTLRHSGYVNNLSCVDVETKVQEKAKKTTLWMPEARHCAVEQHTVDHFYVHFFVSGSANAPECLGWVQCKLY